tara:strand:- start:98 stop:613 length:516 start_codon:yes stop_codon:yes gene_type:complete
MKIKKSELLALIKEEIMAEAEMFKMSDKDLRDFSVPDPQEYRDADEIFNMVMTDLEKEVEEDLLDIIKEIMMERPGRKPQDMANEAFGKLMSKMRGGGPPHGAMQEGKIQEGVDPNDVMTMMMALKKLMTSPYTGPLFAAVIAGMPVMAAYEKHVLGKMNKEQPPVDGGEM